MTGSRPIDCSAVAARTQCRRMIWEIATWVSALLSITAVLFGFLTDESIQLHVTCALVLGVIPAAAVLLLAAVLVSLLRFLGMVYDLLRTALAHGLVSCISLIRAFLVRIVNSHEPHMNRVLVQAAGQLSPVNDGRGNLDPASPKKSSRRSPQWVDVCCSGGATKTVSQNRPSQALVARRALP